MLPPPRPVFISVTEFQRVNCRRVWFKGTTSPSYPLAQRHHVTKTKLKEYWQSVVGEADVRAWKRKLAVLHGASPLPKEQSRFKLLGSRVWP